MKNFVITIFVLLISICLSGCGPNPEEQQRLKQEAIDRGRELYLTNGCAVCHGREGRGDGLTAKQYYPLPTNFYDVSSYRQGADRGAIMRSIKNGVPREGSAMAAFDHFSEMELRDLAIFLESLQESDQTQTIEE